MFRNNYRYHSHKVWLFVILTILFCLQGCTFHQKSVVKFSGKPPTTYRIVKGDTLFSIAWRYGLKYEALAKYNGISKDYKIYPGQVIRLDVPKNLPATKPKPTSPPKAATKSTNTAYSKNNSSINRSKASNQTGRDLPHNGSVAWQWPARGVILTRFSGSNTLSKGIDIGGKLGEPVLAAASGQIVYAGSGLRGYGKLLIIRHNDSFLSAYAHNDKLLVKEGDSVKAGQRIADMGSSGTDKVKLHFEIRRDGTPEDPMKYLPKR